MALASGSGDLRRRFYDLTRLVSDWVWETDADFRLTYVSFRVFEALGLHSLELIGRRLVDIGRPWVFTPWN
jgi:PAS domain-containing protein